MIGAGGFSVSLLARQVVGGEGQRRPPVPLPRPRSLKIHPRSSIGCRMPYEYPNDRARSTEEVAPSGRSPLGSTGSRYDVVTSESK